MGSIPVGTTISESEPLIHGELGAFLLLLGEAFAKTC